VGSRPGKAFVAGPRYLMLSFRYSYSHIWMVRLHPWRCCPLVSEGGHVFPHQKDFMFLNRLPARTRRKSCQGGGRIQSRRKHYLARSHWWGYTGPGQACHHATV
jgi:hypothetical protein